MPNSNFTEGIHQGTSPRRNFCQYRGEISARSVHVRRGGEKQDQTRGTKWGNKEKYTEGEGKEQDTHGMWAEQDLQEQARISELLKGT